MRGHDRPVAVVFVAMASLSMLALQAPSRAGSSRAPIPVSFGPNIKLSVESYSQAAHQRETTVAVNPRDPRNVVEGNIDRIPTPTNNEICSFSFTNDGGQTWGFGGEMPLEIPLPLREGGDFAGDPALAADADGNFYYSYIDVNPTLSTSDVVVAKSTDGGKTFPTFTVARHGEETFSVFSQPDKDYIAVDSQEGSPFKGTIYVVWSNLFCGDIDCFYQIMVTTSRDRGETWSDATIVGTPVNVNNEVAEGPLPVVGPDGTVFVFYEHNLLNALTTDILFVKSTDGGRTWSDTASVASHLPSPGFFGLQNASPHLKPRDVSQGFAGILGNSFPTAAITPDGTIFVAWTDFPNGSCLNITQFNIPCTNADVRLSVSRDGGGSWTPPVKVSDDTGSTDQFFPWIAAHPNGLVSLVWLDRRLDPNNEDYDVFYTNTFDGVTFLPNVRVTTETSRARNQQMEIQDYIGMAVTADSIFPAWSDMRSGNPDIYTTVGHFTE